MDIPAFVGEMLDHDDWWIPYMLHKHPAITFGHIEGMIVVEQLFNGKLDELRDCDKVIVREEFIKQALDRGIIYVLEPVDISDLRTPCALTPHWHEIAKVIKL